MIRILAPFLLATAAFAQTPRVEAGAHAGALDAREALDEKPAFAGGRVTVRAFRFLSAEAEIDRFPIGGAHTSYPGTECLFGARAGGRIGALGLFATVRPGFIAFSNNSLKSQDIGTRPVINLGVALAAYSSKHIFGRLDFGDLIVSYGPISGYGTRHQFQGTAGFGLWF
jgi:hypothetical protein